MRAPEVYSCTVLSFTLIGCVLGAFVMAVTSFAILLWVIDYILNSWQRAY